MAKEFTQEQLLLIKNTIAKGATDDELALFMATCKRTGLDPFNRQIYMLERRFKNKDGQWERKMEIQASIDGLRVVAERSGKYLGQDGPYWCGEDGIWKDVWLSEKQPAASKIGIRKTGSDQVIWGVATWRSYAQMDRQGVATFMWAKMGDVLLAKCAEALGLRKAFPNDLSGVVADEEMQQLSNEPKKTITQQKAKAIEARIAPKEAEVLPPDDDPGLYVFKTGNQSRKGKAIGTLETKYLEELYDHYQAEVNKGKDFGLDATNDFEMVRSYLEIKESLTGDSLDA